MENEKVISDKTFVLCWGNFFLGFVFGLFGVLATLFARTYRRDRIYSAVLGAVIGAAVSFIAFRYLGLKPPVFAS